MDKRIQVARKLRRLANELETFARTEATGPRRRRRARKPDTGNGPDGRATEPDKPPPRDPYMTLLGEQWPEKDAPLAAIPLDYSGTRFLASQRAGLFSGGHYADAWPWPHPPDSDEAKAGRRPINLEGVIFRSIEPNSPPSLGPKGTKWFSRAHLVSGCQVRKLDMRGGFGASYQAPGQHPLVTSVEGHGLYWTCTPTAQAEYLLFDVHCSNMGGHALQLVTASRWSQRFTLDVEPEPGAFFQLADCVIENTDQAPHRGSSALSFFDLMAQEVLLLNVAASSGVGDIPYPEWDWDGTPEYANTARGLVVQRGPTTDFVIHGGVWTQHGPRPDRPGIYIAGADRFVLKNAEVNCDVHVNGASQPDLHYQDGSGKIYRGVNVTKRVEIFGCTGSGELWIDRKLVGPVRAGFLGDVAS